MGERLGHGPAVGTPNTECNALHVAHASCKHRHTVAAELRQRCHTSQHGRLADWFAAP